MVHSVKGTFGSDFGACVIFGMNECVVEVIFASYGHTTLDIPDPIRTPKSSRVGPT